MKNIGKAFGRISFQTSILLVGIALLLAALVFMKLNPMQAPAEVVPVTSLLDKARNKELATVQVQGDALTAMTRDGKLLSATLPPSSSAVTSLMEAGVVLQAKPQEGPSMLSSILLAFGPVVLLVGAFIFMNQRASGSRGGANPLNNFGRSRAKELTSAEDKATFAEVAGCDEAKAEVAEIVDFLRNPAKFQKLGGRVPKGVMLAGPPGTGKTLLAKAIAGEADVPFFSISGSDFVEMFVGVGASRVRDLFAKAKEQAPCIVFIDEIDAVGRKRGSGTGGGNDEREQTLNQMLVEMDGFGNNSGIIVIAATNRPDVLDSALMRPGRFDRQVVVGLPDLRGREQILNVHLRKVPVDAMVDVTALARGTPGFSGAELGNLVNEAALFAAHADRRMVTEADFELAKDKLMMGPERRSARMPEAERRSTAYHESGHAVLGQLLPTADRVHKVSIMPRGRALGVTISLPDEDRHSLGKKRILDDIAMLFGGRIAEELFTDDITTGASNDYDRANALARNLVTRWGMSDALGPLMVGGGDTNPFGMGGGQRHHSASEETMRLADEEVRRILQEQYNRAKAMLQAHRAEVEAMTKALLQWETIDADQVADVMAGRPVREPRAPGAPRVSAAVSPEQQPTATQPAAGENTFVPAGA